MESLLEVGVLGMEREAPDVHPGLRLVVGLMVMGLMVMAPLVVLQWLERRSLVIGRVTLKVV